MPTKKLEMFFGILTALFMVGFFDYAGDQKITNAIFNNKPQRRQYTGTKIASSRSITDTNSFVLGTSTSVTNITTNFITSYVLNTTAGIRQMINSSLGIAGGKDDLTPLSVVQGGENTSKYLIKANDSGGNEVFNLSTGGDMVLDGKIGLRYLSGHPNESSNKGLLYTTEDGEDLYYMDSDGKKVKLNSKITNYWSKEGNNVYLGTKYNNVGIGTKTPTQKLEIKDGNLMLSDAFYLMFGDTSTRIYSGSGVSDLRFDTGGVRRMILESSGNVGIGGTPSSSRLFVDGSISVSRNNAVGFRGNIGDAFGEYIYSSTGMDLRFLTANNTRLTILNGGNIGIGTTSPTEKLDINSDTVRLRTDRTISSSTEPCSKGEISWDSDSVYVCVGTDTWKKSSLSSW